MMINGAMLQLATLTMMVRATPRILQHDHDHDHDLEVCACAAAEAAHPFGLDCTDTVAITASTVTLGACAVTLAGCEDQPAVAGVKTCQAAFFHVQFIHNWCPHDTLTALEETLVHTYEDVCLNCAASAPFNATVATCAQPTCADTAPALAAFNVLNTTCTATGGAGSCCATDATKAAWKTVLAYHDLCDHDDVPTYIENGYHDFEGACEDDGCNTVTTGYDATVCPPPPPPPPPCDPHAGHDHRRLEECEEAHHHGFFYYAGIVTCVILVIGGVVFMYIKKMACFAGGEKGGDSG